MTEGEQRMSKALEAAHWRIKELERENAELRKDAARMQWIVDNDVDACHLLRTTSGTFIRREIDAAIKKMT